MLKIKRKNGEESGLQEEILMINCKRPVHPDDHLQKDVPFADAMGMVFFSKQCNTDVFGHMLSSQMMQLFGLNHPS